MKRLTCLSLLAILAACGGENTVLRQSDGGLSIPNEAGFYVPVVVIDNTVDAAATGYNTLVSITALPPGDPNCANGGKEIETGLDTNRDGILEQSEVSSTSYVCTVVIVETPDASDSSSSSSTSSSSSSSSSTTETSTTSSSSTTSTTTSSSDSSTSSSSTTTTTSTTTSSSNSTTSSTSTSTETTTSSSSSSSSTADLDAGSDSNTSFACGCSPTSLCNQGPLYTFTPANFSQSFTVQITAPGNGNQDYAVYDLDVSAFTAGGTLTITGTVGDGVSQGSFDLFRACTLVPVGDVSDDGGPNAFGAVDVDESHYDINPGATFSFPSYPFTAGTTELHFASTGAWGSVQGTTNTALVTVTISN